MNKIQKILNKLTVLDIHESKLNLNFGSKFSQKSGIGGLLSLVYVIVIILIFVFKYIQVIEGSNVHYYT